MPVQNKEHKISEKIYVNSKNKVGTKGPGQYIVHDGTADNKIGKVIKVLTITGDEELVDQAQAQLTDINYLLENAKRKGLLNAATQFEGEMDNIFPNDYQEAMNIIAQADSMFESLPSDVRNRFKGNPKEFLAFVQNPANGEELVKMGIAKGNDGFTRTGAPSGAPTDLNKDGKVDTVDTNADGVPDAN